MQLVQLRRMIDPPLLVQLHYQTAQSPLVELMVPTEMIQLWFPLLLVLVLMFLVVMLLLMLSLVVLVKQLKKSEQQLAVLVQPEGAAFLAKVLARMVQNDLKSTRVKILENNTIRNLHFHPSPSTTFLSQTSYLDQMLSFCWVRLVIMWDTLFDNQDETCNNKDIHTKQ